MPLPVFRRRLRAVEAPPGDRHVPPLPRIESYPPLAWPPRRAWHLRIGDWLIAGPWAALGVEPDTGRTRRCRGEALAAARLDFADTLIDVRTRAAGAALDRIAVTRTLFELWHFREEVFSLVSQRHDQAEAARRVSSLDRHFPKRVSRTGFASASGRIDA